MPLAKKKFTPNTTGFGAVLIAGLDPHHIIATPIPGGAMSLVEEFGVDHIAPIRRCTFTPKAWKRIRAQLQHYLNARLQSRELPSSKFNKVKETAIDRLLGREIAVLGIALECVEDPEVIDRALHNWHDYTPEDLWWMYARAIHNPAWAQALRTILTA